MKREIIITHAFGPDNRGDHELLLKLIKIIRNKFGNNQHINIFTSFPEKSKEVFNDSKLIFQKSPLSLAGNSRNFSVIFNYILRLLGFLGYILMNTKLGLNKSNKSLLRVVENADFIFYCPGGYLFSNGRSFIVNLLNGLILKRSKGNIYFSPMSIGPFYSNIDYKLCKLLLKSAKAIFLRESFSYDLVKSMGYKNIYLTTDLAWYDSNNEGYKENYKWKNRYVITVIDWNYNDLGNQTFYKDRYLNEIIACCKKLYKLSNNKVILYNQVGSGKGNSKDEILINTLMDLIPEFVEFEGEELTPNELKDRLHFCKGLIASRFHSALFAIQADAPFIALSYQPKAEYILKDTGLSSCSRKIFEFSGEEVANSLYEIEARRDEFVLQLNNVKIECINLIKEKFIDLI